MITFYFGHKGIGGVQSLFLNITKELYRRNIQVKFIYFRDTWLINELDKDGIEYKLFDLDKDNIKLISGFINKNDVIVTTLSDIIIKEIYQTNPFFLFWIVHPETLKGKPYSVKDLIKKAVIKQLIKQITANGGFYFMDKSCSDSINDYFGLNINDRYLPIPVVGIEKPNNAILESLIEKRSQDIISLSYIGRAEIWKVNPVKKIISDLSVIRKSIKKEFKIHIFTDNVEEFERMLSYNSNEIEIIYHSNIFGRELELFLKNEILINFAMGTSCLESSKLGIPSILIDPSYDEFPQDYKYNWIYTTESFSLGKIIDKNYISTSGDTLIDIFNQIIGDNSFICELSNKCLEYTFKNHDIETITSLFIEKTTFCKNKITPSVRKLFPILPL
jgi:hypothetical protein